MSSCSIEPHYLPSLAYFKLLSEFDTIVFDVESKFVKQSYRNRCRVLLSNKIGQLIVPVQHKTLGATLQEVKVDYSEPWNKIHWKSIESAYGKTPFFEHYAPFFERLYVSPPEYLTDFVMGHMKLCFKFLGWKKELLLSTNFSNSIENKELKNLVHSKKSQFSYSSPAYHQAFGEEFMSNLSVLDALFNIGPETGELIRSSRLVL